MKSLRIPIILLLVTLLSSCHWFKKDTKQNITTPPQNNVTEKPVVKTKDSVLTYETYHNKRYDFEISYPKAILIAQGESDSGDGQVFEASDKAELRIYRDTRDIVSNNFTMEKALDSDCRLKARSVSYSMISKNKKMYVVSGMDDEMNCVYYKKTILSKSGQMITAELTFKESLKPKYDPLIKTIFESFK